MFKLGHPVPIRSRPATNDRGNAVRIVSDQLVWLRRRDDGPVDVFVPSEYAPIFAVDLPLASRKARQEALPFAVEDRLAQPLEAVHAVLGQPMGENRYLASVVERDKLGEWIAQLASAGVTAGAIVPDAAALPAPLGPRAWAVCCDGDRRLIRASDGECFATSADLLATLWNAAGQPPLEQVGAAWPTDLPEPATSHPELTWIASPNAPDLLQQQQRTASTAWHAPARIAAGIVGVAAVAQIFLLALDASFVAHIADTRRTEVAAKLAQLAPGTPAGPDPGATLASLLPGAGESEDGHFLPLLSRTSAALQSVAQTMTLQSLAFDEQDGALELKIETSDLARLEAVQTALRQAGLAIEAGAASVADGRAEASVSVKDSGS